MTISFDGKKEADMLLSRIKASVAVCGKSPLLTIFYATERPDQKVFSIMKKRTAERLGISVDIREIPNDCDEKERHELIISAAQASDGILMQLPLSPELDRYAVLNSVPYEKDVEGLSIKRMGALMQTTPHVYSPVAKACMHAITNGLSALNRSLPDQNVVIVGNSYLAGRPLASILSRESKSLTVCNHRTSDLSSITATADIIISVTGKPWIITKSMIKEGSMLIDVGFIPQDNGKVIGDISPDSYAQSSFYTPVPGGIGPLTIAYIFDNLMSLINEH